MTWVSKVPYPILVVTELCYFNGDSLLSYWFPPPPPPPRQLKKILAKSLTSLNKDIIDSI